MKALIECFIPTESGPVFSLGLVKALKTNGIDVYALLSKGIENATDWEKLLEKDHLFILKNDLSFKEKPWNTFFELLRIKRFFKNIKFDFWIDTFPYRCWRVAPFIKYKSSFGIDHDVIPHSSASTEGTAQVRKCISRLDNVIVLSKIYINIVARKYNIDTKHVYYMRHGVMEYPKQSENIDYNNTYDCNFLYFGRIDGYKGLRVLAKAYRQLKDEYDNISLTVAGGGDFSGYTDDYMGLNDCKIVNKYLTEEEIAYYFSKPKTVLILPYLDASQSGVLGVAFNYNTPVIVSDTGGLREQLFDGSMGLFAEPNNNEELYERMKEFLIDNKLYESQRLLMKKGLQMSTWDYCVKEFLEQIRVRQ